jgi:hypothetical protein
VVELQALMPETGAIRISDSIQWLSGESTKPNAREGYNPAAPLRRRNMGRRFPVPVFLTLPAPALR